ncbi:hypothetical protein Pint_03559 [Pistacia integerrima]|uniref:Uncharacterized protein n=1 Tax=Pistacia integerrima TaxID=434235 RepID=A0ACC0ZJ90_9ROSI|nr:hypothetical protein Pint_03559 [Pistacia integerrima]
MGKSKVLVVGGTGHMGRRIVTASLAQGHITYVLQRPEIGLAIDKLEMLLSFKKQGARLIEGSFSDYGSLVEAVKKVDVRFLPSEFGMDAARMGNAIIPGRAIFDDKMIVRKAIEEAKIPFTYISANCFAGYFVGNLSQLIDSLVPPKQKVFLYGDGNTKVVYMDEDDIAAYTIKTIDDPRALNKTVFLRPPENILSQRQLVEIWEKLSGEKLEKVHLSGEDFLASMKDMDFAGQVHVAHFYHIFYEGCLTNFEIGEGQEEASELYPEVNYTRMDDYLKRFL